MIKILIGFIAGVLLVGLAAYKFAGDFMLTEYESPFGVEETAARIQANIQSLENRGWKLSALRNPARAAAVNGTNVLPVLLVEACSTDYSAPLLKDDETRILSILMPCTITIYKKDDGKTYIGIMNSGLMGKMFGPKVGSIMGEVAKDQQVFIKMDPSVKAPPLIRNRPGGGGGAGAPESGC
jgi:uncharacterized protein (DUF302 family)